MNKQDRKSSNCWKCVSHDISLYYVGTKLIGEYNCKLCNDCLNDFEKLVRDHPLRRSLDSLKIQAQLSGFKTIHDGADRQAEIEVLVERMRDTESQLYAVAENWVSMTGTRNPETGEFTLAEAKEGTRPNA